MRVFCGWVICLLVLFVLNPKSASAECDVQEVVEMVEEDLSTRMIKDVCNQSVDVPECSLSKVIRLARSGDDEDHIYEQCEESLDDSYNLEENYGLPYGSVVQPCGCWGYVNLGARD